MKNLFPSFAKLAAVAFCALTLGSCSRAEYAMLPKGASYHGVTRAATPVPAQPETVAVQAPTAAVETPAPVQAAAPATEAVAAAPTAPAAAPTATKEVAPTAKALSSEESAAVAATAVALPQSQAAPKLTRVQKFAATRLLRTMSKVAGISQVKQTLNVAKTQKVSGNLRMGIILILIGLLISLFNRVSSIFGLIGAIVAIIGLIFIILWLLDNI